MVHTLSSRSRAEVSRKIAEAFIQRLYAKGRKIDYGDVEAADDFGKRFAANGCKVKDLVVDPVASDAFSMR
ncbi:MAG: DUF1585 domain-containing protein [Planctomycetales bacterium]